jgi:ankyrin repeat protein
MSRRDNRAALSELMQALYQGKTGEAHAIAEARSDLDAFEAAAIGDVERLRALLDEDRSLANAWSEDGFTPLHFAAFFGHPEAAKLLIERGAELEARSTNREFALDAAPLHSASAAGQLEVCEVLLDAGADVNAVQHGGFTALLDAAANGNAELVERLMERGADRSARLDDGRSAAELWPEEKGSLPG